MFTLDFKLINKDMAHLAGGKGASLGEMTNVDISVPPGFVITADAFDKFIIDADIDAEIETILKAVNHNEINTVEYASAKIQNLILGAKMSEEFAIEIKQSFKKLNAKYVAVRSSATAEDSSEDAWAGQLESYLNTTEKSLLENVKKCWASLFTPRAIYYRFEKGLNTSKISVAVVVQKMVKSEKSGIAFSVHPVTEDYNQLIIEAGFGLGEAIVSGAITPDSYVVDKTRISNSDLRIDKAIVDINVSTKNKGLFQGENGGNEWKDISKAQASSQVLLEKEILELSELIIKIENHYGFPCDIEWAQENGKFYITQSRPITTLSKNKETKNSLSLLGSLSFSKQISYEFIPVICFESAMRSYKDNPLQKRLGIGRFPVVIEILTDKFEEWDDQHIEKINELKDIKFVIKESRLIIKKHTKAVNNLLQKDYAKLEKEEFVQSLEEVDDICMEVYQRYLYFIHEFFETDNLELIKLLPEVRIELSEFVGNIYTICDRMIKALSERFDEVPWRAFTYATFEEIIDILKGDISINDFKKINGRSILFIYNDGNLSVIKDRDLISEINIYLAKHKNSKNIQNETISGHVSFGGMVQGVVIMILEHEYKKVNEILEKRSGYVLVTPMTRPEIVPYLKNAKAIITDEGGITCHASIISRELNIPCIVGTGIATQVLKDGDLVEVDANSGVVRILKKYKNEKTK